MNFKYPAKYLSVVLLMTWMVSVSAFFVPREPLEPPEVVPDTVPTIRNTGQITLITQNTPGCYYIYRGQEMGFEYDLAKTFAEYLGVDLKVNIDENWVGMIPSLLRSSENRNFIGANFTMTEERKNWVKFSKGYLPVQQHIIVHRNNSTIKTIEDLSEKSVHVRRGTSYQDQLEKLRHRGIDLHVVLHDDVPTEELIRRVAEREIEVTIAKTNIAMLNRRYYPQVVMADPISEEEYLGWAVNPAASEFLQEINHFFKIIKNNGVFETLYNRYYRDVERFDYVDLRTFHRRLRTRLPKYSQIIQDAADQNGFDWRLIAAVMYQESHFNPSARSHAGASGLMQLTRSTASSLGVDDILHPVQNIHAGVQHLRNLYNYFDDVRDTDRLKLMLAAYNIGQGHIWDAQRLAISMDLDPYQWSSITKTLPLLSYKKYYRNSKYGYCRGNEAVNYVKRVLIYYDILRRQGIEYAVDNPSAPGEAGS